MKYGMMLLAVLIVSFLTRSYAQVLSKHEIRDFLMKERDQNPFYQAQMSQIFDSVLAKKLAFTIEKLKTGKIDTFCIYSISFPGYIMNDSCSTSIYPIELYVLWSSGNKIHLKKITGKCEFQEIEDNTFLGFDYFAKYKEEILKEEILPVVLNGKIENGKFIYSFQSTDHEPIYSLYIVSKTDYKYLHFTQNDISNTMSIFYYDNIDSKSYALFAITNSEIQKARH